jgi:hypothetical protein
MRPIPLWEIRDVYCTIEKAERKYIRSQKEITPEFADSSIEGLLTVNQPPAKEAYAEA